MKNHKDTTRRKSTIKMEEEKILYKTNYQTSEAVIKLLLDKIIISAVHSSQSKKIDEELGNFCFNSFKNQITALFETNYINYTDDLTNEEPKLLWNFIPPPYNTWVELNEPEPQEMDRYESSNIEYIEIKKDEDKGLDTDINSKSPNLNLKNNLNSKKDAKGKSKSEPLSWNNNNIISEVEEKSSLSGFDGEMIIGNGAIPEVSGIEDKSSGSLNITDAEIKKNIDNVQEIVEKEVKDKKNIVNPLPKKEETIQNTNKDTVAKINEKKESIVSKTSTQTPLPPVKKKGKNIPLEDFPFSDIPGVEDEYNHDNFEPQNVEFLRREREELIQKKLNEIKLKEISNKIIKPIEDNEKVKKKLIDTNRVTFDSNGNIIHFRPYKIDNLSKDFISTRNTIRGFEPKTENPIQIKKRALNTKEKKEKGKENTLQEEIIKNVEEEKKVKEINNIVNNANNEKERYIPSGSNFQIISPNIGVKIKENNQEKEGPREFSKYFNKYSIHDYDKMLNDFVPLQNKTMIQNKFKSSNTNSKYLSTTPNNNSLLNKKSSILSNLDSNNNNNTNNSEVHINPLLPNEDQSSYFVDKDKSINNSGFNLNSNNAQSNPLLPSNMNSMNLNRYNESYNSINIDNSIVMTKLGTGSLKLELDSLKDLSTINSELINIPIKRKNIFGNTRNNKTYKIRTQTEKNNFNDFNKKIMAAKGWGNDTINLNEGFKDKNNLVYARHITKQQVLRELGQNILTGIKVRLPRDRKVEISNNI